VISGFHLLKKDGYSAQDFAEYEEIARRLYEYPCTVYTCHCTGTEPYGRMKAIMGDQLRYIRTGEEVGLGAGEQCRVL
jgi:7,8-dihydropterin-6-yl-methyl-4-(beta-D-ribofuranosyl)aminobenzene 5'-phosphate synthase